MSAFKTTILILAMCLAVIGCRALPGPAPAGRPPVEEKILLGTGSAHPRAGNWKKPDRWWI